MRRASRKKQDVASSREESTAPPVVSGPARRQQPPQEVFQQQRKKHQDELAGLTTKNYRLAKELADLRLKHREECKHVTRLTMENMNLASRCREAISHVAMLKKELAMQQKRTAQALASQREQTKRMADSLTNSFISFNSPESMETKNRSSDKKVHRISAGSHEDEGIMRLISTTPSPARDSVQRRIDGNDVDGSNHGKESHSKLAIQTSTATTSETNPNFSTIGCSSPTEVPRDSSSKAATNIPTDELNNDDALEENALLKASMRGDSNVEQMNDLNKNRKTQKQHALYSSPKKSERSKLSSIHNQSEFEFNDSTGAKTGLFPYSASPQVLNKSNVIGDEKSYDEGYPPDTISQPESSNLDGNNTKSKRKMNLMNSIVNNIDAFEQSFSTDFPDSFTPKESNSEGSGQKIYNPFFTTPEKSKSSLYPSAFSTTPNEEKTLTPPAKLSQIDYSTPTKNTNSGPLKSIDKNSKDEIRPKRPEKTIPLAARARYERALGPRVESSSSKSRSDIDKSSSSDNDGPTALLRRIQQKKRITKSMESMSNDLTTEIPPDESSSFEQRSQPQKAILNIVDRFEQTESGSNDIGSEQNTSTASRFQGPIRSLRRRSVKKPISYAEPPLNTKLRRGDTFFPKTAPNQPRGDVDHNKVPKLIQPAAVVSP